MKGFELKLKSKANSTWEITTTIEKRKIKSSGEKIVKINFNNKQRIYCSECQQKSEVQAELKAVKGKIYKVLIPTLIGVVAFIGLIIAGVVWWFKKKKIN